MNSDGAIVSLGEGFVMVGGPDVGFVVVFFGCDAEIDDELLCSTDSQVGVNEGDVLFLRFLRHQRIETLRSTGKIYNFATILYLLDISLIQKFYPID